MTGEDWLYLWGIAAGCAGTVCYVIADHRRLPGVWWWWSAGVALIPFGILAVLLYRPEA